jgi:hypothetical protein
MGCGTERVEPRHQLHHQRARLPVFFQPINLRYVRMIERSQHFRFALKSRQALAILRYGAGQDFDGHFAIELGVFGSIHLSHAARANGREDLVGTQPGSRTQGHI